MNRGEWRRLADDYDARIKSLKEEIARLEHSRKAALAALEARCVQEHGGHKDDGGMFYGFCTRCGACLG